MELYVLSSIIVLLVNMVVFQNGTHGLVEFIILLITSLVATWSIVKLFVRFYTNSNSLPYQRCKSLIEKSNRATLLLNKKYQIEYINQKLHSLFDELKIYGSVGDDFFGLALNSDLEIKSKGFFATRSTQMLVGNRLIELQPMVLQSKSDKVIGYVVFWQDITDIASDKVAIEQFITNLQLGENPDPLLVQSNANTHVAKYINQCADLHRMFIKDLDKLITDCILNGEKSTVMDKYTGIQYSCLKQTNNALLQGQESIIKINNISEKYNKQLSSLIYNLEQIIIHLKSNKTVIDNAYSTEEAMITNAHGLMYQAQSHISRTIELVESLSEEQLSNNKLSNSMLFVAKAVNFVMNKAALQEQQLFSISNMLNKPKISLDHLKQLTRNSLTNAQELQKGSFAINDRINSCVKTIDNVMSSYNNNINFTATFIKLYKQLEHDMSEMLYAMNKVQQNLDTLRDSNQHNLKYISDISLIFTEDKSDPAASTELTEVIMLKHRNLDADVPGNISFSRHGEWG